MSANSRDPADPQVREKTWQGMMKVGQFAGVALMFIAVARFAAVHQLEGRTVFDTTTLGTFGLGILTLLVTKIAPRLPEFTDENKPASIESKKKAD